MQVSAKNVYLVCLQMQRTKQFAKPAPMDIMLPLMHHLSASGVHEDLLGTVRQLARVQGRHVWSVNPENIQKLSAQKIAQGAESVQQVGPGLMAT